MYKETLEVRDHNENENEINFGDAIPTPMYSEAKVQNNCECFNLINKIRIGNCFNETLPINIFCYTEENLTCPNSKSSKCHPKIKYSEFACELKNQKKSTANGEKKNIFNLAALPIIIEIISSIKLTLFRHR